MSDLGIGGNQGGASQSSASQNSPTGGLLNSAIGPYATDASKLPNFDRDKATQKYHQDINDRDQAFAQLSQLMATTGNTSNSAQQIQTLLNEIEGKEDEASKEFKNFDQSTKHAAKDEDAQLGLSNTPATSSDDQKAISDSIQSLFGAQNKQPESAQEPPQRQNGLANPDALRYTHDDDQNTQPKGQQPISGSGSGDHSTQLGIYADSNGADAALNDQDNAAISEAGKATGGDKNLHVNSRHVNTADDGAAQSNTDQNFDNGVASSPKQVTDSHDAGADSLKNFVADTLDNAQKNNAKSTWISLSSHGNPEGLIVNKDGQPLSSDQVAQAIADGEKLHADRAAAAGKQDNRKVDGVIDSSCGGDNVNFEAALDRAGVTTFVGSSNPTTALPSSIYPLLTKDTTKQQFADALVSSRATNSSQKNPSVNVEDIGNGRGRQAKQAALDVDQAVSDAVKKDPSQKGKILNALKDVPSSMDAKKEQNVPDITLGNKPGIAAFHALANDQSVDLTVRQAAQNAENILRDNLAASSYRDENNYLGIPDLQHQAGPSTYFPTTEIQDKNWHGSIEPERGNGLF